MRGGDGGDGCAAFRREAHTPRGGPCGGDGGNGGNVVLRIDAQLSTLLDFRYQQHHRAQRGENGRPKDQYGKGGADLILSVPPGTIVYDIDTGELLCDLGTEHEDYIVAKGGHGGRGNIHFKSAWNQAPKKAEPGTKGESKNLRLELKLLADVGLLGLPSVGKSTIISRVSRAKPKIAAYPFTTLTPNLGVVRIDQERTFVMADIPGLVAGAAQGAGLGHRFLRHVERTKILLHILEANETTGPGRDPIGDFDALNQELHAYAPELSKKPQLVVVNKSDLTETRTRLPDIISAFLARGMRVHPISAATGEGMEDLLEATWHLLRKHRTTSENRGGSELYSSPRGP